MRRAARAVKMRRITQDRHATEFDPVEIMRNCAGGAASRPSGRHHSIGRTFEIDLSPHKARRAPWPCPINHAWRPTHLTRFTPPHPRVTAAYDSCSNHPSDTLTEIQNSKKILIITGSPSQVRLSASLPAHARAQVRGSTVGSAQKSGNPYTVPHVCFVTASCARKPAAAIMPRRACASSFSCMIRNSAGSDGARPSGSKPIWPGS